MIRYSFIVPVYGCEAWLEECVDSLLNQTTEQSFEIILVDDGARDNSGRIADDLAARDSRVRTFHKENGGAASARNYGLRHARGEYILFIDGDDTVEPQYLQDVDCLLSDTNADLIISGISFDYYTNHHLTQAVCLGYPEKESLPREKWLQIFLDLYYKNCISSACSKVFSARIIRDHNLRFREELILYEDLNFSLNYLQYTNYIAFSPSGHYHYRIRTEANRYPSRIADLSKVNQMLSVLNDSMQFLHAQDGIRIQCSILQQVMQETFSLCIYQPSVFMRKAEYFQTAPEFLRLSREYAALEDTRSPIFRLLYGNHLIRLWFWIAARKLKRTIRRFIKRIVVKNYA